MPDQPNDPKDAHTIRKALNAIRSGANVTRRVGPHSEGFKSDHPVLIASFFDRDVARTFQKILIAHGIEPNISKSGNKCHVSVDAKDARPATEIYFDQKSTLADGKVSRNPRRHDLLIFCTVIGLTLCLLFFFVVAATASNPASNSRGYIPVYTEDGGGTIRSTQLKLWVLATKASLLLLGLFMVTGYLGDRYRMKKQKDPKLKRSVDVGEFLLLFAVPVMFFVLIETMTNILPHVRLL